MAATPNSIITPQTPVSAGAVAATGDVAFNAPATTVTLLDRTLNNNGFRGTRLYAIPRGAIGAALNCLAYAYDGTTKVLLDSALMPVVSPGASVANAKTDFGYSEDNAFFLKAGLGIEVAIGTSIANGVAFKLDGGLF